MYWTPGLHELLTFPKKELLLGFLYNFPDLLPLHSLGFVFQYHKSISDWLLFQHLP